MPTQAVVSVVKAGDDKAAAIARAVELAGLDDVFAPGQRVTVKPNWHGGDCYTCPEMVVGATRYVRERGAADITVGDGPFYGSTTESFNAYVDKMGVRQGIAELGATLLYFHDEPYHIHRDLDPALPAEMGISAHATDCDVLVNLPLMKTHLGTLVTIGMKNLKGCIRPVDKAQFHKMELHAAIVALNKVLRPAIHIMDATTAYEGLGPGNGTPVDLGLVLCSDNVVALDAVAVYLMGMRPRDAKLVQMGARAGLGPIRLDHIDVRGERLDDHRRTFELPYGAFKKQHPNLRLEHEHACSGCLGNFLMALSFAPKPVRDDYPAICLGRGTPPAPGCLLVGDCACRDTEGHTAVPGCPPSIDLITAALLPPTKPTE